jgi:hypothetical protein
MGEDMGGFGGIETWQMNGVDASSHPAVRALQSTALRFGSKLRVVILTDPEQKPLMRRMLKDGFRPVICFQGEGYLDGENHTVGSGG